MAGPYLRFELLGTNQLQAERQRLRLNVNGICTCLSLLFICDDVGDR
jgi:hypothetical protein